MIDPTSTIRPRIAALEQRVERLEAALARSHALIRDLVGHLRAALGDGFSATEFERELTPDGDAELLALLAAVADLVRGGSRQAAADMYRGLAGVSHDQAVKTIGEWDRYTEQEHLRRLRGLRSLSPPRT